MSSSGSKRYDAFLSFNSQDRALVRDLDAKLKAKGLETFFDERDVLAGDLTMGVLAEALYESKSCLVLVGESGLGGYQAEELQTAIRMHVEDREFRVIPVLLRGAKQPRRGDAPNLDFLFNRSWVDFRDPQSFENEFDKLIKGINGQKLDRKPASVISTEGSVKNLPSETEPDSSTKAVSRSSNEPLATEPRSTTVSRRQLIVGMVSVGTVSGLGYWATTDNPTKEPSPTRISGDAAISQNDAIDRLLEGTAPRFLIRLVDQQLDLQDWLGSPAGNSSSVPFVAFAADYEELRGLPLAQVASRLGLDSSMTGGRTVILIDLDANPTLDVRPASIREVFKIAQQLDERSPGKFTMPDLPPQFKDDAWSARGVRAWYKDRRAYDSALKTLMESKYFASDFPQVYQWKTTHKDCWDALGFTRGGYDSAIQRTTADGERVPELGYYSARAFLVRNVRLSTVVNLRTRHIADAKYPLPLQPWLEDEWKPA